MNKSEVEVNVDHIIDDLLALKNAKPGKLANLD